LQLDLHNWVHEYNEARALRQVRLWENTVADVPDAAHLAKEKMLDRLTIGNASDTLACVLRRKAILKSGMRA
jgi:hypothetical protein